MNWIDTIIVGIVIFVGLWILYRALKEPIDLLFHWIGRGFGAARDKISGAGYEYGYNSISYG